MLLPFHIALRFLFRSRGDRPLTLFTAISVMGIALSVLLFLLIDTVMNGFSERLAQNLIGFDAPLTLDLSAADFSRAETELKAFAARHPEFGLRITGSREFYALLKAGDEKPAGIKVRSVNAGFLKERGGGRFVITWLDGADGRDFLANRNALILGRDLYREFESYAGFAVPVTILHPFADLGPSGELEPAKKDFVVVGYFSTGVNEIDSFYALVPEIALAGFANPSLMETQFYLHPARLGQAETLKTLWQQEAPGFAGETRTWLDRNRTLFKAMQLERIIFIILFVLLVVISCLNLASVVRIFGTSKIKDAAVLRSLGLPAARVRGIFLAIGALLGGLGGVIGLGVGLAVVGLAGAVRLDLPAAYELAELPLKLNGLTVAALLFGAPFFSALVAFWPARLAARGTVVEVMRAS